jgi:hypothetical protein
VLLQQASVCPLVPHSAAVERQLRHVVLHAATAAGDVKLRQYELQAASVAALARPLNPIAPKNVPPNMPRALRRDMPPTILAILSK